MESVTQSLKLVCVLLAILSAGAAHAQKNIRSYNLTVSVSGAGKVFSDLPGIDCPGSCTAKFNQGTPVTLTAAAGAGATFSSWSGACGGSALECNVTINSNTSVTATFTGGGTTIESLEARIIELEAQLTRLQSLENSLNGFEQLFAGVARGNDQFTGYDTLYFDGMNVAIRNGAEDSTTVNGLGNLIVGYNESYPSFPTRPQSGSHNLVLGRFNSYTSHGGFVGAEGNVINGSGSSVIGGTENTANGNYSVVVSGRGNSSDFSADQSMIGGGTENRVTASMSVVTAGWSNTANGYGSSVSGGAFNSTNSVYASVSGGAQNNADGDTSSISGGIGNRSPGMHSAVAGGGSNVASGERSSVTGGNENSAENYAATVSGGLYGRATNFYSTVGGGSGNLASGFGSFVGGGNQNAAETNYSAILGGLLNRIPYRGSNELETIVGGDYVECEDLAGEIKTCGEGSLSPVD